MDSLFVGVFGGYEVDVDWCFFVCVDVDYFCFEWYF